MAITEQGRRLRRDVAWNLIPVALLGVVGIGVSFLIARWWGAAAFGVFNLVTTAYFALSVAGACGLHYSVLRAIAEAPHDRDRVATVVVGALVPNVVLAAAATAVFVAIRPLIARWLDSPAVAEGMLWAAPALFCFAVNKLLFGVVNGLRRMRAFAIYTSLRYVLIAIGLVLANIIGLAPAHLPAIWTFTEGTLLLVLAGELVATVRLSRATGWAAWTARHLDYGVRGVIATLAYEINTKLDVWMLGVFVADKGAVGVYSLAAALHEGVTQLAVVVQNNVNPVIARLSADGDAAELRALVARTRRWFVPAMIGVCVLSAALYPLVIPWLIGDPAFAAGALPFAILMAGIAIASPYLPFAHLLLMARRPGWHTVLLVVAILVNAIGGATLIPELGPAGAGAAMAATVVATALLLRGIARWRIAVRL
ncbi:MAG TPA: oligosaccharide flippase family protein [Kofleriaceae bacterium]|nr:oligosaccharide flippase family protein [Kofleriaceae bacterium]